MEADLQITMKGLPDELANNVGNAVASVIRTFGEADNPLDFRRMHRIIIASDFAGELATLSSATASGNPITHTNEEYAVAVAKVLLLPRDDGYEILPVINAQVAAVLTEPDKNPEGFKYVFHMLHHELCHVHDDNKKIDALPSVFLRQSYGGKGIFTGPLAEACWSEYFANLLSSSSAIDSSVSIMADSLTDAINRTKSQVDAEILNYRFHGNLDQLMNLFKRHGEFLIIAAAYVLGYMDGLGKNLEEISDKAAKTLSGSYFEPTWIEMQSKLRELHKIYPNGWNDLSVFDGLAAVLENYYTTMGLILSTDTDGRAYVHVPFRPETMPFGSLTI